MKNKYIKSIISTILIIALLISGPGINTFSSNINDIIDNNSNYNEYYNDYSEANTVLSDENIKETTTNKEKNTDKESSNNENKNTNDIKDEKSSYNNDINDNAKNSEDYETKKQDIKNIDESKIENVDDSNQKIEDDSNANKETNIESTCEKDIEEDNNKLIEEVKVNNEDELSPENIPEKSTKKLLEEEEELTSKNNEELNLEKNLEEKNAFDTTKVSTEETLNNDLFNEINFSSESEICEEIEVKTEAKAKRKNISITTNSITKASSSDALYGAQKLYFRDIELDFADGPGIKDSTFKIFINRGAYSNPPIEENGFNNWKISGDGREGNSIYEAFRDYYNDTETPQRAAGTDLDAAYYVTNGSSKYLKLPVFDQTTVNWGDGQYEFKGWQDSNGDIVTLFEYAYQYDTSGTLKYTAIWEPKSGFVSSLDLRFIRSDDINLTLNDINDPKKKNYKRLKDNILKLNISPDTDLTVNSLKIPGYKISRVITSSLSNVKYNGDASFKSTDFKFDSDYNLSGYMPNHRVQIAYIYEPDKNVKFNFTIQYINSVDGSNLFAPTTILASAEEMIKIATIPYIAGKKNMYNSIITGEQYNDELGVYPLGYFRVSGDNINPNQPNFNALMPNQDLIIKLNYIIDTNYEYDIKMRYQFEGLNEIVQTIKAKAGTSQYLTFPTNRNGFPTTELWTAYGKDDGFSKGSFTKVSGDGNYNPNNVPDLTAKPSMGGYFKFYYYGNGDLEFLIKYSYDYTSSEYWKRVIFNSSPNGKISVLPGGVDLDKRNFSKGEHYLSEIIASISVAADKYYKFNGWFKGKPIGKDTTATKSFLPTDKIDLQDSYYLFPEFIEEDSEWSDIEFKLNDNETHAQQISGTLTFHETADKPWSVITFPTVTPISGFSHNKLWKTLKDGKNYTEAQITSAATLGGDYVFEAVLESNFQDDSKMHKCEAKITYDSNNYAKALIIGAIKNRKYAITDRSGKILAHKSGTSALSETFDNLCPGTKYNIYEIHSNVADTTIANGKNISGVNSTQRSAAGEINIPALRDNYTLSGSIGKYKITITAVKDVQYALLNKDGNTLIKDFGSTTFDNLSDSINYIVVARSKNDSISATDAACISQGVEVFTEKRDITSKKYRLVVLGGTASSKTANETISTGLLNGANVYYISEGEKLSVSGTSGNYWLCMSGNIEIQRPDFESQTFYMPNSDVILINSPASDFESKRPSPYSDDFNSELEVITNGLNIYVDKRELLKKFDSIRTQDEVDNNYEFKYYLIFNSIVEKGKGQKIYLKTIKTINGCVRDFSPTDAINVCYLYNNDILNNTEYGIKINGGTFTPANPGYDVSNPSYVGSTIFELKNGDYFTPCFTKLHKISFQSDVTTTTDRKGEGPSFTKSFDIIDGCLISSITDYNTEIAPLFKDYIEETHKQGTSTFKSELYLYNGLKNGSSTFNKDTAKVAQNISLKVQYKLDEARETAKIKLNDLVQGIPNETNYPYIEPDYLTNTLTPALTKAQAVVDDQINKTVAELNNEYSSLNQLFLDAPLVNPPKPVLIKSIAIKSTPKKLKYTEGDNLDLTGLSINATYDNGNVKLKSYPTDDTSKWSFNPPLQASLTTNITKVDVKYDGVSTSFTIKVEAKSKKPDKPDDPVVPSGGGGGGGGGGGTGAKGNLLEGLTQQTPLVKTDVFTPINHEVEIFSLNSLQIFKGNLVTSATNNGEVVVQLLQNNGEVLKDGWVSVVDNTNPMDVNKVSTYRINKDGNAISGIHFENGKAYYFSNEMNNNKGKMIRGWVQDPISKEWLYTDNKDGIVQTGQQIIDGKTYFFDTSNDPARYGKLLTNTIYKGYYIDANGVAIPMWT